MLEHFRDSVREPIYGYFGENVFLKHKLSGKSLFLYVAGVAAVFRMWHGRGAPQIGADAPDHTLR